jgi:molybdenum cofactor cytidylyltransferase
MRRTFGLIPAAGKSRRMGRPKLLLPFGDTTVLERVLLAVHSAGVADVLVVVAPDAGELAARAATAGAHVHTLAEDTPDMRTTCLHGLAWLGEHFHPRDDDGWLLLPADHPTVRPEVVRAILAAADANPDKSIIVPTHAGRRGHPTWLRWSHVTAIRALPPDQGLNAFIRAHAPETLELPWPGDDILRDLDTPEDYRRLITTEYTEGTEKKS